MKEITEDYVSYETAKLLKEKGFKGIGAHFYDTAGNFLHFDAWMLALPEEKYEFIEAPTLQMSMKWLREVHHIFIQVELYSKYDDYCFELFQNTHRLILEKHETYNNYEEASESAIKYVLENLI